MNIRNSLSKAVWFNLPLVCILFYTNCSPLGETLSGSVESASQQVGPPPPPPPPGSPPPPPPPPVTGGTKLVDVVVGYGPGERTILSCDGGQSWTANKFTIAPVSGVNLSHTNYSANDLRYNSGKFYYVRGWFGDPDRRSWIFESTDGINWTEFSTPRRNFADTLILGANVILADSGYTYTIDGGVNWLNAITPTGTRLRQ